MEANNEDALETIHRLRQEIKNKDRDIHLAAKFGKELLEKNGELGDELAGIRSENEFLKQGKYSLQLDLETKVQIVNTQNSELETQRHKYDKLIKKFDILQKESIRQKQRINNSEKEKIDFEKALEDAQRENCALKKRIDLLERQVQGYQMRAETAINLSVLEEDLKEENNINFYKEKIKQLQDAVSELQGELESTKLAENRLNSLVKELEESIQDRDKEIASYSVEVQKAKDVATELQGEIELLKLEQVDVNRRGNSVFGELDDRRELVEKKYKLLSKKYENMRKDYANMKREISDCKSQMAILLSMTSRSYQDDYINKLEDHLGNAKREIRSLTMQLDKVTKSLQQSREDLKLTGNNEYDYLKVLYEQAEKRVKALENELITARMKNMNDSDQLFQTTQQLYQIQTNLEAEKLENMKLKRKIKELTPQSDNEASPVFETNIEDFPDPNSTDGDEQSIVSGEAVLTENGIRCLKTTKSVSKTKKRPLKLDELLLKESQIKPKEEENCELSACKQDSSKYSYAAKFRQHCQRTRKPPDCVQQ